MEKLLCTLGGAHIGVVYIRNYTILEEFIATTNDSFDYMLVYTRMVIIFPFITHLYAKQSITIYTPPTMNTLLSLAAWDSDLQDSPASGPGSPVS